MGSPSTQGLKPNLFSDPTARLKPCPDTKLEKGKALRTTYAQIPANSLGIGSLATFVSHTPASADLTLELLEQFVRFRIVRVQSQSLPQLRDRLFPFVLH